MGLNARGRVRKGGGKRGVDAFNAAGDGGGGRGSAGKKTRGEDEREAVRWRSGGWERGGGVGVRMPSDWDRTVGERGERLRDGAGWLGPVRGREELGRRRIRPKRDRDFLNDFPID